MSDWYDYLGFQQWREEQKRRTGHYLSKDSPELATADNYAKYFFAKNKTGSAVAKT